jgi:phage protein D
MSLRRPTFTINGVPAKEAEVLVHRYQSASAFSAMLSMTLIEKRGGSVNDWVDKRPEVSIKASSDGGGGRVLISGKCDAVEADWYNRTIHIDGRDATANLLDTNIDPVKDQFKNKSADDIVREIAGRAGLSMEGGGGGGGGGGSRSGRTHVNDEYDYLTGHQSLFNIIQALAEREGKTFWVDDKTLHWVDVGSGGGDGGSITIRYRKPGPGSAQGNFTGLKTIRNFMADEAKADVTSYQTRKKQNTGEGADGGSGGDGGDSGGGGGDSGSGGSDDGAKMKLQTHNMTEEQAKKVGESITAAAQQHAMRLIYEGPGNANADPRMTVTLSGTGTVFDTSYDCDSIRHILSEESSYTMIVDARTKGSGGGE